jgi:hypothetical protein
MLLFKWDEQKNSKLAKNSSSSRRPDNNDDRYLERIFILDAAANGVFVPGAERVFDDEDDDDRGYGQEYEDDYDSYSYYEQPVDEGWDPGDERY